MIGRIAWALAALAPMAAAADPFPADRADKVLRYAFERAETTFDPQKTSDVYSNFVESAIFDTPLDYDYLARPLKMMPGHARGDARDKRGRQDLRAAGEARHLLHRRPRVQGQEARAGGRGLRLLDQAAHGPEACRLRSWARSKA